MVTQQTITFSEDQYIHKYLCDKLGYHVEAVPGPIFNRANGEVAECYFRLVKYHTVYKSDQELIDTVAESLKRENVILEFIYQFEISTVNNDLTRCIVWGGFRDGEESQ